jgi:imidazole glycerol-phosphate synthase subunit HisH
MIGILNYGLGNIKAFSNIYKSLDLPYKIVNDNNDLKDVDKIILPGVGAFDDAMKKFNSSGLREKVEKMIFGDKKIPILGICVGLQMFGNSSDEGNEKGLGWINGVVKKIDINLIENQTKLPHMGWNTIIINNESDKLFKSIKSNDRFYFLHSYYFECHHKKDILAYSHYGTNFSCSVKSGNVYGVQFHPEKSLHNGEKLLYNFAQI